MSLKEKLKEGWAKHKSERADTKYFNEALKAKRREAYEVEKFSQAETEGKVRARMETKRAIAREKHGGFMRGGFGDTQPVFGSGLFGEPMGIRRPKVRRTKPKRSGKTIYVNGVEIRTGSKSSHRKKAIHRRKRSDNPFGFGDSLF